MWSYGYLYEVHPILEFTPDEVELMTERSRGHHDHRCRSASEPAPGAFLHDLRALLEPGPILQSIPQTVCLTLSIPILETLAKILEPTPDDPPEGLELYRKIKAELRDAKQARSEVNAERPREGDTMDAREVIEEIQWGGMVPHPDEPYRFLPGCPFCDQIQPGHGFGSLEGHTDDCHVAKALPSADALHDGSANAALDHVAETLNTEEDALTACSKIADTVRTTGRSVDPDWNLGD